MLYNNTINNAKWKTQTEKAKQDGFSQNTAAFILHYPAESHTGGVGESEPNGSY